MSPPPIYRGGAAEISVGIWIRGLDRLWIVGPRGGAGVVPVPYGPPPWPLRPPYRGDKEPRITSLFTGKSQAHLEIFFILPREESYKGKVEERGFARYFRQDASSSLDIPPPATPQKISEYPMRGLTPHHTDVPLIPHEETHLKPQEGGGPDTTEKGPHCRVPLKVVRLEEF
ncbi:hypothetical protein ACLOJK_026926 [Asimina triloba]